MAATDRPYCKVCDAKHWSWEPHLWPKGVLPRSELHVEMPPGAKVPGAVTAAAVAAGVAALAEGGAPVEVVTRVFNAMRDADGSRNGVDRPKRGSRVPRDAPAIEPSPATRPQRQRVAPGHGVGEAEAAPASGGAPDPVQPGSFDKTAYQREYMKNRRAAGKTR